MKNQELKFNQEEKKKIASVIILIFVAIIYFAFFNEDPEPKENKSAFTTEMFNAKAIAENYVSVKLKAPSTAEFSDLKNTAIIPIEGGYKVAGFVDSQNDFGAVLRSYYSVDLVIDSTGKSFYKNFIIE